VPAEGFDIETVDKLLTTTRAVRKRLDLEQPVPLDVITECIRLALHAPTGTNLQNWRWLVITDPEVKLSLAELYRHPFGGGPPPQSARPMPDTPAHHRMAAASEYLRDRIERVPVLVVPCVEAVGGAAGWAPSIYPAAWSFMLALRSRGLGSVITTVHLYRRDEADALLGVPDGFVQSCLIPVAYYTGTDFGPAERRPVEEVTFLNHWGHRLT
jgi:nitroreductase